MAGITISDLEFAEELNLSELTRDEQAQVTGGLFGGFTFPIIAPVSVPTGASIGAVLGTAAGGLLGNGLPPERVAAAGVLGSLTGAALPL